MPKSGALPPAIKAMRQVHALGHPSSPAPRTAWGGKGVYAPGTVPIHAGSHAGSHAGTHTGVHGVHAATTSAAAVPTLTPSTTTATITTPTTTTPTSSPRLPNAPAQPSLAQGVGTAVTVGWTAVAADATHDAASSYNLRSSPAGADTWSVATGIAAPYTLSGLASGATVDVQIQAVNTAGAGAWSPTATIAAARLVPNVPAAPSLTARAGGGLTVAWTTPATDATHAVATGFNLRYGPAGSGSWTAMTGVSSPTDLPGLAAGTAFDAQVQAANGTDTSTWSATGTLTTAAAAGPNAPNAPVAATLAAPADGTAGKLTVTWAAPATDASHDAATGYNLRYGPVGAGTWTTLSGVSSPVALTGLTGGGAFTVQVQGTNAAASPGAWSAGANGTAWGATVSPGVWVPAATQTHGASLAANGGVMSFAAPAPTTVAGVSFAWSAGNTVVPTSGMIAASPNGQTNGWGQYFNAPATAGTYYLWTLAQASGGTAIGALVSSAITVN